MISSRNNCKTTFFANKNIKTKKPIVHSKTYSRNLINSSLSIKKMKENNETVILENITKLLNSSIKKTKFFEISNYFKEFKILILL